MSAPLLSCYVTCRKLLRIICCFCNFFPPPFLFTVDDALQLISSLFSCNSEILFIHSYANNTEIKHFFPFIFSILIIFYPPNFYSLQFIYYTIIITILKRSLTMQRYALYTTNKIRELSLLHQ